MRIWLSALVIAAAPATAAGFDYTSRPKECLELTARVVKMTGGQFKAGGERDDEVTVGDITIQIDCGFEPAGMSLSIDAEGRFPPNSWFAVAAETGHSLAGESIADIEKAARKCLLDDLTGRDNSAEVFLPKTWLKCYEWGGNSGHTLTFQFENQP